MGCDSNRQEYNTGETALSIRVSTHARLVFSGVCIGLFWVSTGTTQGLAKPRTISPAWTEIDIVKGADLQ